MTTSGIHLQRNSLGLEGEAKFSDPTTYQNTTRHKFWPYVTIYGPPEGSTCWSFCKTEALGGGAIEALVMYHKSCWHWVVTLT